MVLDAKRLADFARGAEDEDEDAVEDARPAAYSGDPVYAGIFSALSQCAPYLDDLLDDLPADVLRDPEAVFDDLDEELFLSGISKLPDSVRDELQAFVDDGGVSEEVAASIAEALADRGLVRDAERTAGWLTRASIAP